MTLFLKLFPFHTCFTPDGCEVGRSFLKDFFINHIKLTIMNHLLDILTDEKKSFEFPLWVPAVLLPLGLVALMCIAGWLETLV